MIGFYGAFDRKRSNDRNIFNQITMGAEYWYGKWFIGGNIYKPIGQTQKLVGIDTVVDTQSSRSIAVSTTEHYEKSLPGIDAELGHAFTDNLTGYVGGYYFHANGTDTVTGPKISAIYEYNEPHGRILGVLDGISVEVGAQHDKPRGYTAYVGVKFKIGLTNIEKNSNIFGFERHMVELVRRDPDIVIGKGKAEPKKIELSGQQGYTYPSNEEEVKEGVKTGEKSLTELLKEFGLPENATWQEVRKKYKEYALKYHPDKNKDGKSLFVYYAELYGRIKNIFPQKTGEETGNTTRSASNAGEREKDRGQENAYSPTQVSTNAVAVFSQGNDHSSNYSGNFSSNNNDIFSNISSLESKTRVQETNPITPITVRRFVGRPEIQSILVYNPNSIFLTTQDSLIRVQPQNIIGIPESINNYQLSLFLSEYAWLQLSQFSDGEYKVEARVRGRGGIPPKKENSKKDTKKTGKSDDEVDDTGGKESGKKDGKEEEFEIQEQKPPCKKSFTKDEEQEVNFLDKEFSNKLVLDKQPQENSQIATTVDDLSLVFENLFREEPLTVDLPQLLKEGKYDSVIRILIEKQKDLKIEKEMSQKLLYLAAELGCEKLITILHKLQLVDLNGKNNKGKTALHLAVENKHDGVVGTLLGLKVNPLASDTAQGQTALHLSVVSDSHHSLDITKKLLRVIDNIDGKDLSENTPLHIAASQGKLLQTRLLIKKGANREIMNKEGKRPQEKINKDNERLKRFLSASFDDNNASDTDSEDESDYEYNDDIFYQVDKNYHAMNTDLIGKISEGKEVIRFHEERISPNGNCGFIGIGTDRAILAETLIGQVDNTELRKSIWEEIAEAILTEEFVPQQQEVGEILALFQEGDEAEARRKLKEYCLLPEVFVAYLDTLQNTNMWLGYQTMLAFARVRHISVYIWHRVDRTNNLILDDRSHIDPNPNGEFHLLHTAGFTHFNLLVRANNENILEGQTGGDIKKSPEMLIKPKVDDFEHALIAHYSGVHFFKNLFKRFERRKMISFYRLQQQGILRPTGYFSDAVYEIAKQSFVPNIDFDIQGIEEINKILEVREKRLQEVSSNVKAQVLALQKSGPVKCVLGAESKCTRTQYKSRYLEFIQCYVNKYDKFINLLKQQKNKKLDKRSKQRSRDLQELLNNLSFYQPPLISTSEESPHALKYAMALHKNDKKEQEYALMPQYQQDGHPRFPYLGVVYVTLHSVEELAAEGESSRILDLITENLIDVNIDRRGGQKERTFVGSIDVGHVYAAVLIRVPDFYRKYKEFYLRKYGLKSNKFEYFAKQLLGTQDENFRKKIEQKIVKRIVKFKTKNLLQVAEAFAKKNGYKISYLDVKKGLLTSNSPKIEKFKNLCKEQQQIQPVKSSNNVEGQLSIVTTSQENLKKEKVNIEMLAIDEDRESSKEEEKKEKKDSSAGEESSYSSDKKNSSDDKVFSSDSAEEDEDEDEDDTKGVAQTSKGLDTYSINTALELIIKTNRLSPSFYISPEIMNEKQWLIDLKNWQQNDSSTHYSALLKLENKNGSKHAVLLHVSRLVGQIFRTEVIDPLSKDDSEFTEQINHLVDSINLPGIIRITYSGRQDKGCSTCADMSLIMLQELAEHYAGKNAAAGSIDLYNHLPALKSQPYLLIHDDINFSLDPKLSAQAAYFVQTGIVFESLQRSIDSGAISIVDNQFIELPASQFPTDYYKDIDNERLNLLQESDSVDTTADVGCHISTPYGTPFISLDEYDQKLEAQLRHYALTGELFDSAREAISHGYSVKSEMLFSLRAIVEKSIKVLRIFVKNHALVDYLWLFFGIESLSKRF